MIAFKEAISKNREKFKMSTIMGIKTNQIAKEDSMIFEEAIRKIQERQEALDAPDNFELIWSLDEIMDSLDYPVISLNKVNCFLTKKREDERTAIRNSYLMDDLWLSQSKIWERLLTSRKRRKFKSC